MTTYRHTFTRHKTREVKIGDRIVGGDNPILVQSMTVPDTHLVDQVVAEILRLEEAGCELVRVTVPKPEDAGALSEIKKRIHIPLICDIHFDYKMAVRRSIIRLTRSASILAISVVTTAIARSFANARTRAFRCGLA